MLVACTPFADLSPRTEPVWGMLAREGRTKIMRAHMRTNVGIRNKAASYAPEWRGANVKIRPPFASHSPQV